MKVWPSNERSEFTDFDLEMKDDLTDDDDAEDGVRDRMAECVAPRKQNALARRQRRRGKSESKSNIADGAESISLQYLSDSDL